VARARSALDDDGAMSALPTPDRQTLRHAIDALYPQIDAFDFLARTLHGEPHLGNVVATPGGLRWVDLEDVCVGPLEWDLAFLPEEAVTVFTGIDIELLGLLRILNSACVATWCWLRADIDGMLWHANHHLERVKTALPK
jgi:Phosphotransferase enzyme family